MVLQVDFKRRVLIHGPIQPSNFVERTPETQDLFELYDYHMRCIEARYGEQLPKQGIVHTQAFKHSELDTYGFGCVHNSSHQYMPKKDEVWNQPMPMPADLRAIDAYFKRTVGPVIKVGVKSDPFMWMDAKYGITKSVLQLANKHCLALELHTMSDLCAHDDYIELLEGHTIVMQLGFENAAIERYLSPGAPSRLRQERAIERLRAAGITVRTVQPKVPSKKIQMKRLGGVYINADGSLSDQWHFRASK